MEDKTREEMLKKIEAKRKAVDKLESKPEGIRTQLETYRKALVGHQEKIASLEKLIAQLEASEEGSESTLETRKAEIEHMENIVVRYDAAWAKRAEAGATILRLVEADTWMPGDDPAERGAYRRSAEYLEAQATREMMDNVIDNALKDIRKIYVSRGEVSDYNKRELGTELPV